MSKILKSLILVFIVVLFLNVGCREKTNLSTKKYNYVNYIKLVKPEEKIKLRSEVVIKEENINLIEYFSIIDNYLILADSKDDKQIKIFDLKSHKLLKSFGSVGQGPSEFISASQIIPSPKDKNMFWIYDVIARKLKKFSIEKVLKDEFDPPEEIISLTVTKGFGFPFCVVITPDMKILGVGNFSKGRIAIYNWNGSFVGSIGKIPVILDNEKLANQHSHGFVGKVVYKSSLKEIFIATRYGSIIEKYNLDGEMISTFHGPNSFFPKYSIIPIGTFHAMATNEETRYGYLDLCYNRKSDRLFLLYSGKRSKKDKEAYYSRVIYVLNNKGIITEEIILDTKVGLINVSEDGSALFGVSSGNEIIKFKLNKIEN